MKNLNFFKVVLTVMALALVSVNANAQFGGLGKKLKEKAKAAVENKVNNTVNNAVDNATNKVEQTAKKTINNAVEYKTQLNAPQVDENTDIDEKYEALEYWTNLQEMANNKKDIEWLCSEKGEQMSKVYNLILNDNSKDVARFHSLKPAQDRFTAVAKATNAIIYDGYPKSADTGEGTPYLVAALKWYINKAKKGKTNAKNYYVVNGAAVRYLAFCTDRYTDDPAIEKQTVELRKLYDQIDADYKAKYPNANPYATFDEIQAEMKAEKEAAAKRKAEKEAKRKADIEASKQTLKPGALDKSLNAKVLSAAKAKIPGTIRVVVQNDSWTIDRKGGTIARRRVLAWVVTKDEEGNLVAHDYGFAQEYMGGGKYDALRYYSVGLRTVYVK